MYVNVCMITVYRLFDVHELNAKLFKELYSIW